MTSTTTPLRLGYLVPQFPGQTHMFFWREIRALEKLGVSPVLLYTRPPPPGLVSHAWSGEAIARTTYLQSISPIAALKALPKLPFAELLADMRREPRAFLKDLVAVIPAAQRLLDVARREKLDHIHVHSAGRAALIAALARAMGGPPYSLTLHGPLSDYGPGQDLKWRKAAFGTVITQRLHADLQASTLQLPARLVVQAMGVDTDRLRRDLPWSPPQAGGAVRLFSCARLNFTKGHQEAIEAVRLLRSGGRDVSLVIAGEDDQGGGGYRRSLEDLIRQHNLQKHVHLLGAVDEDEVRKQILNAHYFLLASHNEPLGVALMEAMSCEVPVISTAAGGVAELISDGQDGILVQPRAPEAVAKAIVELVENPARAQSLGQSARRKVIDRFDSTKGAETLIREMRRW